MNDEKLHERIEDNLKSEICERVKKLYKPSLFYVDGVSFEEIRRGFSDINRNVICDLLNELVFCDKKLIIVDRDITTEYIPREKLAEIKKEDKKEKKIKDELESEIYEVVKRLSANDYVNVRQIKRELSDIDEDTIIELLGKLIFRDNKLIRAEGRDFFYYEPKFEMDKKLCERREDKLKSEIYEVVKKLWADDVLSNGILPEEVKKELSSIDENTIEKLLNKLVFCDDKLILIERGDFWLYMPK